jgi:hypothetical protein
MDKREPKAKPVDYAIDPTADDVVDLTAEEGPRDMGVRLACSKCHGGRSEAAGGATTKPVRKAGDPDSVVRCARCGKKHSTNSLTVE